MAFKIELRYVYGWDDAGWTEDGGAGPAPLRFPTIAAARTAMEMFFAEVRAAVRRGDMDVEENPVDYRIVEARE
jgi:hypothetical protein